MDNSPVITGSKCGQQIPVRMEGDAFFTCEACPIGQPADSTAADLSAACSTCTYEKAGAEVPPVAAPAAPEVPPTAPPGPALAPIASPPAATEVPVAPEVPVTPEVPAAVPPPAPSLPSGDDLVPPPPGANTPPADALADALAAFQAMNQPAPQTAPEPPPVAAVPAPAPAPIPEPTPAPQPAPEVLVPDQVLPMSFLPADVAPEPVEPPVPGGMLVVEKAELREAEKADLGSLAVVPPPAGDWNLVLPSGASLIPVDAEDQVDVDMVLAQIPGYAGGPSEGGLSSHDLGDFQQCRKRSYFSRVLGLSPMGKNRNFAIGSLYHACMFMRYACSGQGDRTFEPCDAVGQAGAPEMAALVRDLVTVQLQIYGQSEWDTWCPIEVEKSRVYHLPPQKIGRKNIKVPIAFRPDMILGLKDPGVPHPDLTQPFPGPVMILDWKTSGWLTSDLTEGFGMDFQFRTYEVAYLRLGLEETLGRLAGVMVHIAEKKKGSALGPDNYFRQTCPSLRESLDEFHRDELFPLAGEYYRMLTDPDIHKVERRWPKCTSNCIGRWGKCDFFGICDGGSSEDRVHYRVNEARIIDADTFAEPPKGKATGKGTVIDPDKEEIKRLQAELKEKALGWYTTWLLGWMDTNKEVFASLLKENFIKPGAKKETVIKELAEAIKVFYADSIEEKSTLDIGEIVWTFRKGSMGLVSGKLKASFTWNQLAAKVCEVDWYNASKVAV